MLRVLKPITITPAMLTSSNAVDSHAAYAAGTTYASGVFVTYQGRSYESLQGSNTGHTPGLAASATWWLDRGASNRMAMFDRSVGSVTSSPSGALTVVIQPDDIVTALGLLSVAGSSVTVTLSHPVTAAVLYTAQKTIGGSLSADFWEFFFGDHEVTGELLFDGLPPYFGALITVTIDAASAASCGSLLVGKLHDVGRVEYGAEFGITDYSRKEQDAFGNFDVDERAYSRDTSYTVRINRSDARRLDALFTDVRATPCLFAGDEDTDTLGMLMAYGFYGEFRVVVEYAQEFVMALEVKGLT